MEEAEAISDKIGIMVQGKFKCFGTLQDIQREHGLGYDIEINLDTRALLSGFTLVSKDQRYTNDLEQVRKMIKSLEQCWSALG